MNIEELDKFCDTQNKSCIGCPYYNFKDEASCNLISDIYEKEKLLTQLKEKIEVKSHEE